MGSRCRHCPRKRLPALTARSWPLKYRADTPQQLARTLAADPEFGLAHCLAGYFAMLSYKQANVPDAAAAARTARAMTTKATARERAHVEALDAWIAGNIEHTLTIWDDIVTEHPLDVVAFRLAHFNNFWLGRPEAMRASVEQVFLNGVETCRVLARSCLVAASPTKSAVTMLRLSRLDGPRWRSTLPTLGYTRRGSRYGDAGP